MSEPTLAEQLDAAESENKNLRDKVKAAERRVAELETALSTAGNNGWREMDSAPKDGKEILGFWSHLYAGDKTPTCWMEVISWQSSAGGSEWCHAGDIVRIDSFTHWQPLPPAPQVQS